MKRKEFEDALISLANLIENADQSEDQYQKWFEENQLIFEILGYKRIISHPKLSVLTGEPKDFFPDFLIQRIDNELWDIFEIKRPDTQILKNSRRRQNFYASLNSYLVQCREYIDYFDETIHREDFNKRYETNIEKGPRAKLVAGMNADLDHHKVHDLLRNSPVELLTYEGIWELLSRQWDKLYGKFEHLPGFSINCVLTVHPMPSPKSNFIFDIGSNKDKNRISLYVDSVDNVDSIGKMRLQVKDSEGILHTVSNNILYDEPFILTCNIGVHENTSIISLDIHGNIHHHLLDDEFNFTLEEPLPLVLGSDLYGTSESNFSLYGTYAYGVTPTIEEKIQLRNYLLQRYFSNNGLVQCLRFEGNKYSYSSYHPNLGDSTSTSTDLIQEVLEHRPVLRINP